MTFSVVQFGQARVVVGPDGAPITPSGDRLMQGICLALGASSQGDAACQGDAQYWADQRAANAAACAAHPAACGVRASDIVGLLPGALRVTSRVTGTAALALGVAGLAGIEVPPLAGALEVSANALATVSLATGAAATGIGCSSGVSASCGLGAAETVATATGLGTEVGLAAQGLDEIGQGIHVVFDFGANAFGLAADLLGLAGR